PSDRNNDASYWSRGSSSLNSGSGWRGVFLSRRSCGGVRTVFAIVLIQGVRPISVVLLLAPRPPVLGTQHDNLSSGDEHMRCQVASSVTAFIRAAGQRSRGTCMSSNTQVRSQSSLLESSRGHEIPIRSTHRLGCAHGHSGFRLWVVSLVYRGRRCFAADGRWNC